MLKNNECNIEGTLNGYQVPSYIVVGQAVFSPIRKNFFEFFYRGVKTLIDLETLNGY